MSGDSTAKTQSHWDEAYEGDHAEQRTLANIYTLASPLYWHLYGNACFGNTGTEYGWLSWLKRVYGQPRPQRVLELGSGNGDLILDLARMDFADAFVGFDMSPVAVQIAHRKATRGGYANITFSQGDLNQIDLEPQAYDVILAQMTVHHLENLDGLYRQVVRALRPDGIFSINEYVGPTRWRFTAGQLLFANTVLQLLPKRLRRTYPERRIKRGVGRPTVQEMVSMDPSEAVRSAEIYPLFQNYFSVEHAIDYGGSISILVLDTIIANFQQDDPEALRWLKLILWMDHWARRMRLVPCINRVLAGRPRPDAPLSR